MISQGVGDALIGCEFHIHQGLDVEVAILADNGAKGLKEARHPAFLFAFLDAEPAILFGDAFKLIYRDGFKREDDGEDKAGEDADREQAENRPGDAAGVVADEFQDVRVVVDADINNQRGGRPEYPQRQCTIPSLYHEACLVLLR